MEGMIGWRIAGRWCAALGGVLWVVVQVVNDDWFPPRISASQYGLGPAGWVFSVWVVVLCTSPLLLLRYRPVPGLALWLLTIGYAGAWLMALVRTDLGGGQASFTADAHMAGAVLTLVFLPLGIACALRRAAGRWWRIAMVLISAAVIAGILLLLAAAGWDTALMDAPQSWAFWQGVLLIVEMLLVGAYAIAVTTIVPIPVQSSIA